jgi:hypothetical protein
VTLSADEDVHLAHLSELTDRMAVDPFAVGEMEEFLHSLPLDERERLREVVAGRHNPRRSK